MICITPCLLILIFFFQKINFSEQYTPQFTTNPCIGYKSGDSTCSYCNISFYSLKFTKNPSQTISLSDCLPKNTSNLT